MWAILAGLFIFAKSDDDYFGVLPGDVTDQTSGRGYPSSLMSEDVHGAEFYTGWTVTNGFARFYTIQYNSFSMKGELKHGLWKWTSSGAGDKADIWWCEMGGSWDTTVSSGHIDNENQQNMDKIWEVIRNSDNVNDLGPLAEDANLSDFAVNAIRLYPTPSTHLWLNRGTSTEPAFRAEPHGDAEFYYVEHLYGYTDIPLFHGTECDGTNSDDCINLHDTVVVVMRKEITSGLVGLPIFGVHYGNLTTAGACPDTCGEGPCDCDLVLIDVSLDGPLATSWDENDYFVPHWMLGNDIVDVCDGLSWSECTDSCGECAWVCPACKACVPAGCSESTSGCPGSTDSDCTCSCPVAEKCTKISKGLSPTCHGLDRKRCIAECDTCAWTCPTCKVCEGPGSCTEYTRFNQCTADNSCTWVGCEEKTCVPL